MSKKKIGNPLEPDTAFFHWRTRMGFTQKEAAEALGVTVPTFQRLEREEKLATKEYQEPPLMARLAATAIEKGIEPLPLQKKVSR